MYIYSCIVILSTRAWASQIVHEKEDSFETSNRVAGKSFADYGNYLHWQELLP